MPAWRMKGGGVEVDRRVDRTGRRSDVEQYHCFFGKEKTQVNVEPY